ncbi:hypothetical protein PTKIN_Ptkin14bG0121900 [Pterospermum kingtungense]
MDYAGPAIEIANCLQAPLCGCLRYHIKLKDYIKNFKRITGELNSKMEAVKLQLDSELRHVGKVPRKDVENWLETAEEMISEAQHVEKKACKRRYHSRACLGKVVDEKTQAMQAKLDKAPGATESLVIDGPTVGLPLPTSELIGEKVVRDQIWSCLMQEDVRKIGVWGMGGVGKTTIMKHIHNDLLEAKRFDKVIWVTISKELNIEKLQDDIASALMGVLPEKGDKVRRAALLLGILERAKKHILILDDVWDNIFLEEVGIPEPTSSNGSKLVLTTRIERVCKSMGCRVIKVNPLSEDEAVALFLNKVGPKVSQSPTLESTLRLVVKECAGLPLTIVVVAGTLKGEDDPHIWSNALNELKWRIREVEGMEAEVIERLKFSFDHLKDMKLKHCFLYGAFYPEDFYISKDELIECWIDEGFIDEMDTGQQMIDKGHAILKKLEDNCLLEDAYNLVFDECVKMHDAVREMALSIITSDNPPRNMIKAGMQLESLPKEEEWAADIEKGILWSIPDSFFANMPCLSGLNLSSTEIEGLPNSIFELKNLTVLLLQCCGRLRHLPPVSKLQRLKKLDLCASKIEEFPEGMEMLANLRYLDLSYSEMKEVPAGVLPKFSRLQHLRFEAGVEGSSIKAEEVVPLQKLESFVGGFKDINELRKFVQSMHCKKNLHTYRLDVGFYFLNIEEDKVVTISQSESCGDEILLPVDVQQLGILEIHSLRSLSDISCLKHAVDLKSCRIRLCKGIESILSMSSFCSSTILFQSLERLSLECLPRLSELIEVEGLGYAASPILATPAATFSHLKKFFIFKCSNIKRLFLHWLLTNLQNLEEIWVDDCEQLVEILAVATSEDDDEEKTTDKIKVNLPNLRQLYLNSLPELKRICNKTGVMVCDSLERITVTDCSKLKRIPPFLPLSGKGQPYTYAPPSLKICSSREWRESLEWDHPDFKNLLQPLWLQW